MTKSRVDFESRLRSSRLPEAFHTAVDTSFLEEAARSKVLSYLSSPAPRNGVGIVFNGGSRCGKTTAVASVAITLSKKFNCPFYYTTAWLLRESIANKSMYNREISVVQRVCMVPVLVIDNLVGSEFKYGFAMTGGYLAGLLQGRFDARKPTILAGDIETLAEDAPQVYEWIGSHTIRVDLKSLYPVIGSANA